MSELLWTKAAERVLASTFKDAVGRGLPTYETQELLGNLASTPVVRAILRRLIPDSTTFDRLSRRVPDEAVRRLGEFDPKTGDFVPVTSIPSPACCEAGSLAASSARAAGEARVGSAHLLLGLVETRDNIGKQILAEYGITMDRFQDEIDSSGAAFLKEE